jgi:TRAP-type mannitol/chloroaromatic compound transport system permease large subunit
LLVVAVLGSILFGFATPTEASSVGAIGATLIAASALAHERGVRAWWSAAALAAVLVLIGMKVWAPSPEQGGWLLVAVSASLALAVALLGALYALSRAGVLWSVARSTLSVTAMVFGIIISAAMLSLVFRGLGGDEAVAEFLTGLPGGQWGALATVMLTMFLLGFVLEFVEIIYIVIPVVGPIILATDVDPIWFAILVALNLQTSFLTPPFGFALFYFRGAAPPGFETGAIYRGVLPFIALQIFAIVIVAAVPGLATWLPELMAG